MKSVIIVFMMVFALSGVAQAKEAGVCIVDGYLPGQTFLAGIPGKRMEECIAKMQSLPVRHEKEIIVVQVIGPQQRAAYIERKLKASFPAALINTEGAEDTSSEIKVLFSVEDAAAVKSSGKDIKTFMKIILVVSIILFVVSTLTAYWVSGRKKERRLPLP